MPKKIEHFCDLANGDKLASEIASRFQQWQNDRSSWTEEKKELRNYLFQTDTTKTTNSKLPWKNKTTTPKICQIRDNLHANYEAALFPTSDWLTWQGLDMEAEAKEKRAAIIDYMKNKLAQSGFETTVSRLLMDYIDYGNCFGEVRWVNETHMDQDGALTSVYRGPKLVRVSPFDVMFNITAPEFEDTPKITRYLLSYGNLKEMVENGSKEDAGWAKDVIERATYVRNQEFYSQSEVDKSEGLQVDGFSSISSYLQSGMVEILEFEGDIYDEESEKYLHGQRIIIADRAFVAYKGPFNSWLGKSSKFHSGWRLRPDNLMSMGPLDNLVGLQYRIDHLENLKADVFDQIATPVVYERGMVNDWRWGPGEKIQGDENSDVRVLAPDTTALNADMQIANIMNIMEEMAGAPKQAMGIRTPGEKTAFEVQALENAAGRIFQNKITQFEKQFLEPALNAMLEMARRLMDGAEPIRVVDLDQGIIKFRDVTKDDIQAKGKLVPKGARHFAERARAVQTLQSFTASPVYQDPEVRAHISSKELARKFVETLDIDRDDKLVSDFIRIAEQAEAQQMMQAAQKQVVATAGVQPELEDDEIEEAPDAEV
jgi:hypothetical protein